MFRLALLALVLMKYAKGNGCDPDPCVNGECSTENLETGTTFKCICDDKWAGIRCNLPQPEVICGNRSIEIFIDNRIVTEQGLPGFPEFIHFMDAPACSARETSGGYRLSVKAPFKDCGVIVTHNGDDYAFYQQIVWNRRTEFVERPLVLLEFKCTYQDRYTVSFGEITPFETTVDFETSYGTFKVDMALYKGPSFIDDNRYGARPIVAVEEDVCVSTELKNVMPDHLVLTNRECWASTQKDGSGESHYLVSGKCKDDPTTAMLSNGESSFARFCFQMFKWKDSMKQVYVNCVVNVCNATLDEEFCVCENERSKRYARSIPTEVDGTRISIGPVYVVENKLENEMDFDTNKYYMNGGEGNNNDKNNDSKTVILIAVGVVLVISLILLGVVVAVYINCRRKSRNTKSQMRNSGDPVVIPTPANDGAMLN